MKQFSKLAVLLAVEFSARVFAGPAIGLFPTRVQRDLASIESVISAVDSQVNTLDGYLTASSPNPTQIISASNSLNSIIVSGVTTVQESANLSDTDALSLVSPSQKLSNDVNTTITDLIKIKSTIVSLGYGCTTLQILQQQLTGANALSDAIVSKVPAALQSIAQGLTAGIASAIQNGVTAYSGQCSSTTATSATSASSSPPSTPSSTPGTSPASTTTTGPSSPSSCPAGDGSGTTTTSTGGGAPTSTGSGSPTGPGGGIPTTTTSGGSSSPGSGGTGPTTTHPPTSTSKPTSPGGGSGGCSCATVTFTLIKPFGADSCGGPQHLGW